MNGLFELSCEAEKEGFEVFMRQPKSEKAAIIAIALAKRGALDEAGITEGALYDGSLTAAEVIGKIRDLELLGKAVYFPKNATSVARPMPEELKENFNFGLRPEPNPTGEVKVMLNATYRNYFSTQSVRWFNQLRKNQESFDLVYWTENYVHVVAGNEVMFMNIGSEISGNVSDSIFGKFTIVYYNDGEDVPYGGVNSNLLEGYTTLTIPTPTVVSGTVTVDACVGDCTMFRGAGPLTAELQFAVAENTTCLTWHLFKGCEKAEVASADPVQIDDTGKLTVTGLAVGTHKYRVVAMSNVGKPGEFCISFSVKP